MVARILVNTVHRMVYPFLPEFSRAFQVSPAVFARAISFRSLTGMLSPFLARYADSHGRKHGMLLGAGLFAAGMGIFVIWPRFEVFILGLTLVALGKYTMDPSIQAYIGDEVPPGRRGEAIAIIELGWSLSYLVGIARVQALIDRSGWFAPFPVAALLGLVVFAAFLVFIPRDRPHLIERSPLWPRVRALLNNRQARYALLTSFLLGSANELVSLTFAVWLEDAFALRLAALAGVALVIGLSELFGESLVGFLTDRLGAIPAVRIGAVLNTLFALLLPVFGRNLVGAYIGLFLFYLSFEFMIVSAISMMADVRTESRATLMGLTISVLSFGRLLIGWVALPVYAVGMLAVVAGVAAMNLAGLLSVNRVEVREN